MKVLVTGHRGYIGAEMVPALRAAGHEVVGLDTGYFDECDFGGPPDDVPSLGIDLRDVIPASCNGFEAVIHLAALSNDPLGNVNPAITYDINHLASTRLARCAKEAGVRRFLFSSSCSLYGAGGDGLLDETAAFNPVTPYGESKVLVERDLHDLADDSFSPAYFRNATAYGVSRRLRTDIVVNDLVGLAHTTGKVMMKSDGSPWRPLVHIEDIIQAFIAALHAPVEAIHDQAFNVGASGENYRVRQIAELVAEVVPRSVVSFAAGASPDTRNYRVDFSKIEAHLPGYQPRWRLRRGIEQIYRAYCEVGLSPEEFAGPRYKRLPTVRGLQERGVLDQDLRKTGGRPLDPSESA